MQRVVVCSGRWSSTGQTWFVIEHNWGPVPNAAGGGGGISHPRPLVRSHETKEFQRSRSGTFCTREDPRDEQLDREHPWRITFDFGRAEEVLGSVAETPFNGDKVVFDLKGSFTMYGRRIASGSERTSVSPRLGLLVAPPSKSSLQRLQRQGAHEHPEGNPEGRRQTWVNVVVKSQVREIGKGSRQTWRVFAKWHENVEDVAEDGEGSS